MRFRIGRQNNWTPSVGRKLVICEIVEMVPRPADETASDWRTLLCVSGEEVEERVYVLDSRISSAFNGYL
jgi:hypothetical protein